MKIDCNAPAVDAFGFDDISTIHADIGELGNLLRDSGLAAKNINLEVNQSGLADIPGEAGTINVQGGQVKKLGVYANSNMVKVLQQGISCAI